MNAIDALDVEAGLALRVDREAERLEARARRRRLAVDARLPVLDQLVQPGRELAARGDLRVLLAQAAGAAVARVRVQRQAQLLALRVDPRELGLGHEHLAPRLERRGLGEALRDRADRAQVGRDVLAGRAVAAGGAEREPAALVPQRHREAVDLELRDVGQALGGLGGGGEAEALADPGVERPQLVVAERVGQAKHRALVADLREPAPGRRAADLLGRRVRGDQRRATPPRARRAAGTAGRTRRR